MQSSEDVNFSLCKGGRETAVRLKSFNNGKGFPENRLTVSSAHRRDSEGRGLSGTLMKGVLCHWESFVLTLNSFTVKSDVPEKQFCSDFWLPVDNKGQADNLGYTLFWSILRSKKKDAEFGEGDSN